MTWQLQDAKNKLSEVVKAAQTQGPQIISVRGKEQVAVVSMDELRRLQAVQQPLGTYLFSTAPKLSDEDLALFERADDLGRRIDL